MNRISTTEFDSLIDARASRRDLIGGAGKLAALAALLSSAGWKGGSALAQDETPGPAAIADTSGDPAPGGTLTILTPSDAVTMHPGMTVNVYDHFWHLLIYDALVIRGFDNEIYPGLAESWESNEDGTVWTFHLRQDVNFHSGDPLTAAHVVDHFQRWKDFPTRVKVALLDTVEAPDDYTVVCTLSSPTLVFLNNVSQTEFAYASIPNMNKVAELGDDYGLNEADGTGPYILDEWVKDDHFVLIRNENYAWAPEFYDNTGLGFPDRIEVRTAPEDTTRSALIESGEADINFETPPRDAERLGSASGVDVHSFIRLSSNNLGFNLSKPLFQDLAVRQAIMHAINRDEIVEFVLFGQADAAQGYLPPAMPGANPRDVTLPMVAYDPDQANALLDGAGWVAGGDGIREKDGQKLSFKTYLILELQEQICQVIQAQLLDIGVDMQIQRLDQAGFDAAMEANEHDARYAPQFMSTPDHMYFYVSTYIPSPNHVRLDDPEFDAMFTLSQTTIDEAERIATFQAMERYLLENAVIVPILHARWIISQQESVKGTKFHSILPLYKLMDTWLAN